MIQERPNACVRTPEGVPVAWMLVYPYNSLGMMHTQPEHRRKGLGRRIVRSLVRKLIEPAPEDGREPLFPVYCYIVEDNEASQRLFLSEGFSHLEPISWIVLGDEGLRGSELVPATEEA